MNEIGIKMIMLHKLSLFPPLTTTVDIQVRTCQWLTYKKNHKIIIPLASIHKQLPKLWRRCLCQGVKRVMDMAYMYMFFITSIGVHWGGVTIHEK